MEPKKKKHLFRNFVLLIFFTLLVLCTIVISINLRTFLDLSSKMLVNEPSTIFSSDGTIIAKIGNERTRENIKYDDIPNTLIDAYVSIEDQRYYKHFGIDLKRIGSVILSFIQNKGQPKFGGSTITQQLVKNITRR